MIGLKKMNHNLKKAKKTGKNEIHFGNGEGDTDLNVNNVVAFDELGVTSGAEDVIEMKTIQQSQISLHKK